MQPAGRHRRWRKQAAVPVSPKGCPTAQWPGGAVGACGRSATIVGNTDKQCSARRQLSLCASQAWHLERAWCSCLEPASTLGSQGWFCSCPGAVHWSSCHVHWMLISFQTASVIGELCITVSSRYFLNASRQLPCPILNACWELNGYRILSLPP